MKKLEQNGTITAFSREDTKVMKGIAVFLMLMHHLWTFPNRIYGGELLFRFWILGSMLLCSLAILELYVCQSFSFWVGTELI